MSTPENPWKTSFACEKCSDHRTVINKFHKAAPCPVCGGRADDVYAAFRAERHRPPQPEDIVAEVDLSDAEFVVFNQMKAEHPNAHKRTLFAWIEARRYDPSKDPAVRRKVDGILAGWKARQIATAAERGEKWEPGP